MLHFNPEPSFVFTDTLCFGGGWLRPSTPKALGTYLFTKDCFRNHLYWLGRLDLHQRLRVKTPYGVLLPHLPCLYLFISCRHWIVAGLRLELRAVAYETTELTIYYQPANLYSMMSSGQRSQNCPVWRGRVANYTNDWRDFTNSHLERHVRIGLTSSGWKPDIIPLY